ncbi:Ni/Fe hydrogenase subunit delta [Sulfurihydrogenibium subterraneum]|uniref:NADH-quinone oxidoreductase subunit B family protein n=1 Tax=Sulfurihydrogenibium subterraneum TaxID=171121 RepID=UPI000490376F|nr:Ni/Fe hydrogenase subunit delta [Sulfurihydrogenibium subterraneum]
MKIGIFKFSSCDGCQLSFINLSRELAELENFNIDYFLEAQSVNNYDYFDVSFVEGSVSTNEEIERIKDIREKSKVLVSIGACAVSGGVQSIRNFRNIDDIKTVYKIQDITQNVPENAIPISQVVKVDFEIRGCPVSTNVIKDFINSILIGKSPHNYNYPVCLECKRRGNVCLLILNNPCLGPITMAGCNALCPSLSRGCYGCFGPYKDANIEALYNIFKEKNWDIKEFIENSLNPYNPIFREKIWKQNF